MNKEEVMLVLDDYSITWGNITESIIIESKVGEKYITIVFHDHEKFFKELEEEKRKINDTENDLEVTVGTILKNTKECRFGCGKIIYWVKDKEGDNRNLKWIEIDTEVVHNPSRCAKLLKRQIRKLSQQYKFLKRNES